VDLGKLLEKIGLRDFLAYLCPGSVALVAIAFWFPVDFARLAGQHEVVALAAMVLAAYTAGLILASFSVMAETPGQRPLRGRGVVRPLLSVLIRTLYSFFTPQASAATVEMNLAISEQLEEFSGVSGLSSSASPWDRLAIYRVLAAARLGDQVKPVVTEADDLHRRFLSTMGLASALLLLAAQAAARLFLFVLSEAWRALFLPGQVPDLSSKLPPIHPAVMGAVCLAAAIASWSLREFALRAWELERYLTFSLCRLERDSAATTKNAPTIVG